MIRYEWALYELPAKMKVAAGSAADKADSEREAYHYLGMYAQDGGSLRLEFTEVSWGADGKLRRKKLAPTQERR
jgi:hypothetical protein